MNYRQIPSEMTDVRLEKSFSRPQYPYGQEAAEEGISIPDQSDEATALLVMVHGSPRPIANESMHRVVEVVKQRGAYPIVEVGFMECNSPTIPEAIETCASKGAETIIAVPYFLHTGTHVADDLPTLLEEAQKLYPNISFRMGSYLGRSSILSEILAERAIQGIA